MHIHEINPWRTLIAVAIFVVILLIGFLTMPKPLLNYEKSMNESVDALLMSEDYVYPWELEEIIADKPDSIVIFDIRDNFVFGQGHIPGAENLSANTLTFPENIERLKALKEMGTTIILYGEDELQANGPWLFFHQVGFDNMKLLLGGYKYYNEHKDDLYSTMDDDAYYSGFPKFDYADMAAPKEGSELFSDSENKPVEVRRRKKSNIAAGGC
ncbi:rhodanese-like domain-containing protein [uncultured Draconibacterium sp.]|uniref:rhodanese-like domain-containing protein n=1 Tax=uncultured Draconibacterium sp. TaxID=1573823 RepID=UPI0025CEC6E1|nr:rhodanese-like domain-containing protein [uncultured Draconibacterium sp.]